MGERQRRTAETKAGPINVNGMKRQRERARGTRAAGEDAREEPERAGHVARIRCIRTRQGKRGL